MMKMWSAHHQVFSSRGRGSVHPRTARSTTRGSHTAQRVVVRVGVVEQGQTESYYSPAILLHLRSDAPTPCLAATALQTLTSNGATTRSNGRDLSAP